MDATTRAAYDATRPLANKPFQAACYAPFTSLYLNTLGDVVACCRNQHYLLGNIGRESLDQIWSGPRIRAMRKQMLDYKFGPGCEFCEWMIQAGDHQGAMARHFDHLHLTNETPEFPSQIEFALGNECNFACIQCCGDWSSRIRVHREGMPPLAKVYDDKFFNDLRRYLPHLKHAKFFGGEPFLAPETNRVWDMLLEMDLRPSSYILTNGSIWNARVERILEHLTPSICVSIDAIADRELLETIRVGARYDVVTENIRRFRDWSRAHNRRVALSFSLMRQNWTELGPMLLYSEENDFEIEVIRVVDPPQFSLFSLPAEEMLRIADALDAQSATIRPQLKTLRKTWDDVIQSLRENSKKKNADEYHHVKEVADKLRRNAVHTVSDAFHAGRWEDAVRLSAEVPKTHKDYLHGLTLAAHANRRMGKLDACEAVLEEALALTRRQASVFVERAWLRIEQQRFADAIAEGQQALATAADNDTGRLHRGWALQAIAHANAHMGAAEPAAQAIEQWLAIGGEDAASLRTAASYLRLVGREAEADARTRQAEALAGDTAAKS
jgi:MoaA/NifB/PqqE/SkfB family radical SAM enzyme